MKHRAASKVKRGAGRARFPLLFGAIFALGSSAVRLAAPATIWAPRGISSARFESHAAFDPRSTDFYFVRSSPKFAGWRILVSRCGKQGWSEPQPAPFADDGVEAIGGSPQMGTRSASSAHARRTA